MGRIRDLRNRLDSVNSGVITDALIVTFVGHCEPDVVMGIDSELAVTVTGSDAVMPDKAALASAGEMTALNATNGNKHKHKTRSVL